MTEPLHNRLVAIRRQLLWWRAGERITQALAIAAFIVLPLLLANYLHPGHPFWAMLASLIPLPLAGAYWHWQSRLFPGRQRDVIGAAILANLLALGMATFVTISTLMVPAYMLVLIVASLYIVLALTTLPQITLRDAAIFADAQANLPQTMATAYLNTEANTPHSELEESFQAAVRRRAYESLPKLKLPARAYARLDHRAYLTSGILMALAVSAAFIHPLQAPARGNGSGLAPGLVAAPMQPLKQLLEAIDKDPAIANDPAVRDALTPVRAALKQANGSQPMSSLEAAARLQEARQALQDSQQRAESADAAADQLAGGESTKSLAAAARQMQQANEAAQRGDPDAAAKQQAAQKALDQAATEIGDKVASGQIAERKELANKLASASQAASHGKEGGATKKALDSAAAAAGAGDGRKMAQSLKAAGESIGKDGGGGGKTLSGAAAREALRELAEAAEKVQRDSAPAGGQSGSPDAGGSGDSGQAGSGSQGGQEAQNGGSDPSAAGGSKSGSAAGGEDGTDGKSVSGGTGDTSPPGGTGGGGSTNLEGRSGPGDQFQGRQVGKQGTFVKVYGANAIDNKGPTGKATAPLDLRGNSGGSVPIMDAGDKQDGPLVDYSSQLPAARKLAEDAMSRQQIPPQYRELIRTYYEK